MQRVTSGEISEIKADEILNSLKMNYTTAEEVSLHNGENASNQSESNVELF